MMRDVILVASLLFVVYFDISSTAIYYVKPSQNSSCLQTPCLTLSQVAASSHTIVQNAIISGSKVNLSLFFQQGQHILDRDLSLAEIDTIVMLKESQSDENVTVLCPNSSGRFDISDSSVVSITGLAFINCTGNRMTRIKTLAIEETTFQGASSRLLLVDIEDASIKGSSFLNNLNSEYDPLEHTRPSSPIGFSNCNVSINSCEFMHNRAGAGGAIFAQSSTLNITGSMFGYNSAGYGGVMVTSESTVNIDNSSFIGNTANNDGAVFFSYNDSFSVAGGSTFLNNHAFVNGGVASVSGSLFMITDSSLEGNIADDNCGVLCANSNTTVFTTNTTFVNNHAGMLGGVIDIHSSGKFYINNSNFTNNTCSIRWSFLFIIFEADSEVLFNVVNSTFGENRASFQGGVMFIAPIFFDTATATEDNVCVFNISGSTSSNNSAHSYGVMYVGGQCSFEFSNNTFANNRADFVGGVFGVAINPENFNIAFSSFTNNQASEAGGVLYSFSGGSLNIISSNFTHNSAAMASVALVSDGNSVSVDESNFVSNIVLGGGGMIFIFNCSTDIANSTFDHNVGSLYIFSSNLSLSGKVIFENFLEPTKNMSDPPIGFLARIDQEGGAITTFQSAVTFSGMTMLLSNQASNGGALLAVQSTLIVYGEIIVANNTAINQNGGGVSLKQSVLEIRGNCDISYNVAVRGGGIHASSSTINIYQPGVLQFTNNRANNGGGIYLEVNTQIFLSKYQQCSNVIDRVILLIFVDNYANYGGAMYVADETNSGACSRDNECFIQSLTQCPFFERIANLDSFILSGNIATEQGSNLLEDCWTDALQTLLLKCFNSHLTCMLMVLRI